ncbi:phthiodiolone/phenolphthiodiolone dimycocerosates ketoreductase [Intrasporangium sp. DVR]
MGVVLAPSPPVGLLRLQLGVARLGHLDSVMVPDHLQSLVPEAVWAESTWLKGTRTHALFDYASTLGWLAARSGRLRVGVQVTDPLRRHPVVVAQTMLTLAHLTRRAPILGIGSGERENLEPYGLPLDHPTARLEEALRILRACFTGTLADFDGEYYTLRDAVMDLQAPVGRTPEIWVGAHGPRMLELTGRFGDGWIPTLVSSPEDYAQKLERVRAAARQAGRSPEAVTAGLGGFLLLARDAADVSRVLRTPLARFFALLTPAAVWREVGAEHPLGPRFRGFVDVLPETLERDALRSALASVPAEVVAIGVMVGTPDQVVARVRALAEAGLQHFSPMVLSGALSRGNALHDIRAIPSIARRLQSGR